MAIELKQKQQQPPAQKQPPATEPALDFDFYFEYQQLLADEIETGRLYE